MPESPELTFSRDFLQKHIKNKYIKSALIYNSGRYRNKEPQGFDKLKQDLQKYYIGNIDVKGKFMWWSLWSDFNFAYMFCTYGMSGQWQIKPNKYTAFSFSFTDGTNIFFNDQRHFGTLQFHIGLDGLVKLSNKLNSLGPDMLNNPPNLDEFVGRLFKYKHKTLPEVLMNQKVISGIGNYIKTEALYLAKLSPNRTIISLSDKDYHNLYNSLREVMTKSYELHGATIKTYQNPDSSEGKAAQEFKVYGKKKDPNGLAIITQKTKDKRTTYWVPDIQV